MTYNFLFLIFFTGISQGEILKSDYQIDLKYNAGEYLIYDCLKKHYACVDKDSNKNCLDERQEALVLKGPLLPCSPLKKFDDKVACVKGHYKAVDSMALKRFCYPH